jgi:hypothetical protein
MLVARDLPGIHYFQNVGTADSAAWQQVSEYYAGINLSNGEAPCLNDIDIDGDLDLVLGCGNGTLTYFQNTGTPQNAQWAPGVSNYANVNVTGWSAPTFADIDGDGDKDMFVGSVSGTLRYIRRDGPPTNPVWADLGNVPGISVGSHSAPTFADLDGDGDLDLYVGNGSNAGNLYFYRNTGTQYWPAWTVVTPVYQFWDFGDMSAPVFADLNNDNRKDLIIGCNSGGLYHFLNISSIHAVNVYMTPLGAPIIIPRNGGWFNFNVTIINHENIPVTYQAWIMVGLPNGNWYGPVLGPFTQTLGAGVNFSRFRTQEVPGSAPPGVYTYRSFVGNYPARWDSASFNFTKQAAGGGSQIWEDWVCEEIGSSELSAGSLQPSAFSLGEATPNPFNPTTVLSYELRVPSQVSLKIYDTAGRLVTTLVEGWREVGTHEVTFDGSSLASGVYVYAIKAGDHMARGKMVLMK